MILTYTVTQNTTYTNVKEVLKAHFLMSDRLLLKLKKMQNIFLNNKSVYVHHPIYAGDIISCNLNYSEDSSNIVPTCMPLNILYEDDSYLVINKPAGIPIHPSNAHYSDSLSNGIKFYFDKIGLKKKIRPINRLDKDTSGLVIFAKNEYIQECLVKQMKSKDFVKKYIAIVAGHLEEKSGTICVPIARKENSIIERCVSSKGDNAITHFKVLNYNFPLFDVVECSLETGRTHQIRVHLAYIGHPLLGDTLYGFDNLALKNSNLNSLPINRQALHSYYISFIHPITKHNVKYLLKLPQDFLLLLNKEIHT